MTTPVSKPAARALTLPFRLRRAVLAARRDLRSLPPVTWQLIEPRTASERFAAHHVMVTGAAGLIGSALVEAFLAHGAFVHAVDIDRAGLEELEHSARTERLRIHVTDLGDAEAIAALAATIDELSILINNVGFNDFVAPVEDLTMESWHKVLDIDLVGPALLTGGVVAKLAERPGGSVMFVTSINAMGPARWLPYGAAKAGVVKLVGDLAAQLAPRGVRVNAVAPASTEQHDLDDRKRAFSQYPLGHAAVPVEAIVHAVEFLADSTLSPMTTGQHLIVDGGITLERADLYWLRKR